VASACGEGEWAQTSNANAKPVHGAGAERCEVCHCGRKRERDMANARGERKLRCKRRAWLRFAPQLRVLQGLGAQPLRRQTERIGGRLAMIVSVGAQTAVAAFSRAAEKYFLRQVQCIARHLAMNVQVEAGTRAAVFSGAAAEYLPRQMRRIGGPLAMILRVGAQATVAAFSGAARQILAAIDAAHWRTSGDDCPNRISNCRGGFLGCCARKTCRDRCSASEGVARRVLGAELKLTPWPFLGASSCSWGAAAAK